MDDSDDSEQRSGRLGALIVLLVIGGSAVGVVGWHLSANSRRPGFDMTGFDLKNVEATAPRSTVAAAAPARPQPQSGMMIRSEAGIRVADGNENDQKIDAPAGSFGGSGGPPPSKKDQARESFKEVARKNESIVARYSMAMTKKYPSIRRYGEDWMRYPDLKKLNDNYMRNHDPVAFMVGLSQSKNFGKLISKYATDPAIYAFVVDGVKQAPSELMRSAAGVVNEDSLFKSVVSNVSSAMGLPPSMTSMFGVGGGSGKATDSQTVVSDLLKNPPPQPIPQQPQQAPQ